MSESYFFEFSTCIDIAFDSRWAVALCINSQPSVVVAHIPVKSDLLVNEGACWSSGIIGGYRRSGAGCQEND